MKVVESHVEKDDGDDFEREEGESYDEKRADNE